MRTKGNGGDYLEKMLKIPTFTVKTGPIENLPCGKCNNFINTVPVESKFGIPALPLFGMCGILACMNGFNCWYKRLEHICPNCGSELMICNKPIRKGCFNVRMCQAQWHRKLPKEIHDNQVWDNFEQTFTTFDEGVDV